jgi:1-acyl-sn-glycerol-3-phosphate acyltransferase
MENLPTHAVSGMAPVYRGALDRILDPIYHEWFRTQVIGLENIPADGAALIVGNHAGAFAIDALMVVHALEKNSTRSLHLLGADFLFQDPLREFMAHLNVHPATFDSANELLQAGHLVGVWPEGVNGVGKTIAHRYQLQGFGRAGFARLAALNGVPIIPTAVIGSEEAYPLVARIEGLLDWAGFPYLPVTPTFPALGPLGLIPFPSRWTISFGTPIAPPKSDSPVDAFACSDHVRGELTQTIRELLSQRSSIF